MEKSRIKRRHFLAASIATLLAWQFPFARSLRTVQTISDGGSTVWEVEGVTYERISALLEALGGMKELIHVDPAKATVVIKPNFCLPDSIERGTTTSTAVIELFCQWFIAHGVRRIIVVDHTLQKTSDFEKIDIAKTLLTHPEVKLVLANEERMYEPIEVSGKVLQRIDRLKLLAKADLFINMATAKHHSATHVSLGVKNLMGVIWNRSDFHTKMDLSQAIGELALAVHPTITIIDASRVLLNGGPTGPGSVIKENRIFASRDIVAVDAVVVARYNFAGKSIAPNDIAHLRAAAENGIGEINLEKISVKKV